MNYASVTHILPLTAIRRERLLPVPGRVLVRLDQRVSPLDVVAEANISQQHLLIDVARILRLTPEETRPLIKVRVGDLISAKQMVAQHIGLSPHIVRTPQTGRVLRIGGGQVLLEVGDPTFELYARVPGNVTRLISERGVEITFTGALVQGIWGNGRSDMGLMIPLLDAPDSPLSASQLEVNLRGSVVLAGTCQEADVLQAAEELPLRGLILGSMSASLIPTALQVSYPLIVLDNIGKRAMNNAAYKLLTTSDKRDVTLNADPFDPFTGTRPEVYIPLPVVQEPPVPRSVEVFAPDLPVRLLRAPSAGAVGTIVNLKPGPSVLPNGLRVAVAEVRLETGEQLVVPLANLEILG
jgi:hypothetical protein